MTTINQQSPPRDASAGSRRAGRLDRFDRGIVGAAPLVLRLGAAFLWLSNVGWKRPPDFGRSDDGCAGLCGFVNLGTENGIVGPWRWFIQNVAAENLAAFGWAVLIIEATLAAVLLSGRFTRVAAMVGMAQAAVIGFTIANAPDEWYWSYALMVLLHLAVFATATRGARVEARAVVVGASVAAFAALVIIANFNNDLFGADYTGEFILFDGRTDFPGDFGRNVFSASVGFGLLLLAAAAATARIGRTAVARPIGVAAMTVAALGLLLYRADGNILAARPAPLAVLAGLGLWLAATARHRVKTTSSAAEPGASNL